MTIFPVPKPQRVPKEPKGFRPNGPRTKKSGGALFPGVKNRRYRAFIRSLACELEGKLIRRAFSLHDQPTGQPGLWVHHCWGEITPAHVGDHQAQGAPDVACCVPLCEVAHKEYDEHRGRFHQVTGISAKRLRYRAEGYAVRYHERGEG